MTFTTSQNYTKTSEIKRAVGSETDVCRGINKTAQTTNSPKPFKDANCRTVEVVEPNLDLSNYLPEPVAVLLKQVANAMPTSPEMLLTTLLPVSASLIGTTSCAQPWKGWREPSVIWAMNVAPTGSMKSPTMDIITKPLLDLDNKGTEDRDYVVDDFTMEALIQVHRDNPKGLLVYRDELEGFLRSHDKYRGGKGDDSQRWLSLFSGKPAKVNRKGGSTIKLPKTAISIVGSIQFEILKHHLRGDNTHSGTSARWLFCNPKMPSAKYTGKECPDVEDILSGLYLKLDSIPHDSIFVFSNESKELFITDWHSPIVEEMEKESNLPMKAVLAKMRGYCVRIALVLHCINEAIKIGQINSEGFLSIPREISVETVRKAVSLSYFYLSQAESVYGVERGSKPSFPKVWLRLRDISKKKGGWVSARIVSQNIKQIKGTDKIRSLFLEMSESTFGQVRGHGSKLEWKYREPSEAASTLLQSSERIAA